ncbi:TPA: hypothetical protein ACGY8I_001998 [Aeromonas hydrophila]|uniref:hypothetical protein n=1 Tax=Aeromonas hydrophila TaxID=644 RepID=UPI0012D2B854|nr:hypothetical protein [Aeromonas hydrophila]
MQPKDAALIREFFDCTSKLLKADIVRSDKILGDIGEWLCVQKYGLVLEKSGRHPGYDGKIGSSRVQVKVHNSPEGTNLSVGDPDKYDELIVIIGPRSRLRVSVIEATFHSYRICSVDVKRLMKRKSGHYCAKGVLEKLLPDAILLET